MLESNLRCDGEVANTAVCKTAIRGCKSRSHLQKMSLPFELEKSALLTFPGQEKVLESETPEKTLLERILEPYDRLIGHVYNLKERIVLYGNSFGIFAALAATEAMGREEAKELAFRRGQIVRQTERRFAQEEQLALEHQKDVTQLGRTGMMRLVKVSPEVRANIMKKYELHESNNYGTIMVLTGRRNALSAAANELNDKKRVTLLGIDAAYHDPIRTEDSKKFALEVENAPIVKPKRPIITSTNPRIVEHPDDIREELVGMMIRPVNLAEIVKAIKELGISIAADLDPNESFAKLTGRLEEAKTWLQVNSPVREFEAFSRLIRTTPAK